ncbi:hypothetical protein [Microbacterium allomyrinae]|uniref:DUF3558 domain-containing protein n=1 Tax=Microbacterium allomyrinae TaxID=2830666 RepID=A0A9X1LY11_9MICO|nr:hypothetical protein [Microbacterium allomyrinae]MCC2033786.1 hypothetical protein [Microbacterium allomyrinae]
MRLIDTVPRRIAIGAVAIVAVVGAATGCRPEPAVTPSATPSFSVDTPTPGPSVTPIETEMPDAGFELPASCEGIYSTALLADLEATNPPLNDPGVTMLSTENVDVLEILHSGVPTLRCTWGQPSEYGLATNVTVVDAAQIDAIAQALPAAGFGCEPLGDGTVCRIEQRGITLDDEEYTRGESHYLGAGGLVTTAWINFTPEGYTEDIVATLWG